MGFSRHEYWSGLPCPPPGDLPDPGIKPTSPSSSCMGRRILYHWAIWEAQRLRLLFAKWNICVHLTTGVKESRVGNKWRTWSIICSCKEILNIPCKDWCWSWSFLTLATWCEEQTYWKRSWCWERLKAGGEGDDRGCLQESFPQEDAAPNGLGEFSLRFLPPLGVSFPFLGSAVFMWSTPSRLLTKPQWCVVIPEMLLSSTPEFCVAVWLHWVFVALQRLSLLAANRGHSVAVCGLLLAVDSLVVEHRP